MNNTIGEHMVFRTIGASSHSNEAREINDYYATNPKAGELLLDVENFKNVLEPSCGEGHLSDVFIKHGLCVTSSDLINRGYGDVKDFFEYVEWNGDIITNPPYKIAFEFVNHALNIIPTGNKVAMFLKLQFLEGKKRKLLFLENPPKTLYVSSSRITCAKNGIFKTDSNHRSAVAYAWFVWEKGFVGDTKIKWIN